MEKLILITCFEKIEDPRIERNKLYALPEILLVAFATILANGETYTDMRDFGIAKLDFFKTILSFENGIPSADTFERVFGMLNPKCLEDLLIDLTRLLTRNEACQSVALDGKTLRRSGSENKRPLHIVSAWASHNKLVLGCRAVEEKSNEITAIPEILKLLDLKGVTVTSDAIGCQVAIAEQIVEQGGDFALALKENHGNLHDDVEAFFQNVPATETDRVERYETIEKDHGRIEKRQYGLYSDMAWLKELHPQWNVVQSIGYVLSTRIVKNKKTEELRYFVVSYKHNITRFAQNVRAHWGVENSLHWFLDFTLHEDYSRVRDRNAATNLAIMRRLAVNKYTQDSTPKRSNRRKRLVAGWDDTYLKTLLFS